MIEAMLFLCFDQIIGKQNRPKVDLNRQNLSSNLNRPNHSRICHAVATLLLHLRPCTSWASTSVRRDFLPSVLQTLRKSEQLRYNSTNPWQAVRFCWALVLVPNYLEVLSFQYHKWQEMHLCVKKHSQRDGASSRPKAECFQGIRQLKVLYDLLIWAVCFMFLGHSLYIIKNIFSKYSVCVCICCYMTSSKICHLYSSLSLIWTRILRFDLNWSSKFVHYIPGMAVFKQSCQTVRQKERLWALTLLALELCRFLHQTHTHTLQN